MSQVAKSSMRKNLKGAERRNEERGSVVFGINKKEGFSLNLFLNYLKVNMTFAYLNSMKTLVDSYGGFI